MSIIHGSMRHTTSGKRKKTNAWTTKKRKPVDFKPLRNTFTYRGDDVHYPSADSKGCATTKSDSPTYTGTLVKGIGTMHKSNAVPVIDEQQMKDLASMRR